MSAGKTNAKKNSAGERAPGVVPVHGGEGAEVAEDRVQVVERAAAIDVAKGFGMVCTRVPGSRPDRRRQTVWRVEATPTSVGPGRLSPGGESADRKRNGAWPTRPQDRAKIRQLYFVIVASRRRRRAIAGGLAGRRTGGEVATVPRRRGAACRGGARG
jgi:hypothetical protein